jgi:hypothetical protein
MKVGNRLPGLFAAVNYQPVPVPVKTKAGGCFNGAVHDFRPHFGLLDFRRRLYVLNRHYKKMNGRLRGNVPDYQYVFIPVDRLRRYSSGRYLAEKALSVQKPHLSVQGIL